jgi:hypothetical protein
MPPASNEMVVPSTASEATLPGGPDGDGVPAAVGEAALAAVGLAAGAGVADGAGLSDVGLAVASGDGVEGAVGAG